MGDQQCNACGGSGSTSKVEYTYERDADGKEVAVRHETYGTCSNCGGSGRIA